MRHTLFLSPLFHSSDSKDFSPAEVLNWDSATKIFILLQILNNMGTARNMFSPGYSRDEINLGPVAEGISSHISSSSTSESERTNFSQVSHTLASITDSSPSSSRFNCLPDTCWSVPAQQWVHRPRHGAAQVRHDSHLASCRCPAQCLQDIPHLNQCLVRGPTLVNSGF